MRGEPAFSQSPPTCVDCWEVFRLDELQAETSALDGGIEKHMDEDSEDSYDVLVVVIVGAVFLFVLVGFAVRASIIASRKGSSTGDGRNDRSSMLE